MDGSARAETPSDSRASSIAPSASQQSIAGRGTTAPLDGHDDRAGNGAHFPGAVPQTYRPGCKHIRRMTSSELSLMLRHYALGVRWGKKIRRGIFRDLEEDEDSHGQLDFGANGWQNGFVHNRKRKLLPHPSCSACHVTLHKPYLCLTCAYAACLSSPDTVLVSQGCIGQHLSTNLGHDFAIEIHSGHLYCGECKSSISDPRFDLIFQREKGRASGHAARQNTSYPNLEAQIKKLTSMPDNPLSSRIPRGIHNLGATCFLSVILQSFIHNPILRNFFLADRHNQALCASSTGEACMACEMDKLFTDFFSYDGDGPTMPPTPWTPSSFLYSVWRAQEGSELSQAGQQDSHELFISVLNALHSALTGLGKDPSTRKAELPRWNNDNDLGPEWTAQTAGRLPLDDDHPEELKGSLSKTRQNSDSPDFVGRLCSCVVHRTFSGVLQSDVRCLVCGYRSSTHDPVLDLSVDLRPRGSSGVSAVASNSHANVSALSAALPYSSAQDDPDGSTFLDTDYGNGKKKKCLLGGLGKKDRDLTPMKKSGSKQTLAAASASSGAVTPSQSKGKVPLAVMDNADAESQDLLDCLRRYCTSERLPPSSYSCPQCGPVEASKQLSLRRLPPVLCIQLKRFEHTGLVAGSGYKIETKVRFPMRLDVREFITPCVLEGAASGLGTDSGGRRGYGGETDEDEGRDSPKSTMREHISIDHFFYSLFCVIVHEGTLNTGHYWCFCKWKGQWYRLNDAEARPVSVRDVAMEKAYQLVYSRDALENVVCP